MFWLMVLGIWATYAATYVYMVNTARALVRWDIVVVLLLLYVAKFAASLLWSFAEHISKVE